MLSSMVLNLVVEPEDLFDELATRLINESSDSVREVLLGILANQVPAHPDACDGCLQEMSKATRWRILVGEPEENSQPVNARHSEIEDRVTQILLALGIGYGTPFASGVIDRWSDNPLQYPATVGRLVAFMRAYMNPSWTSVSDVQGIVFDVLTRIANHVVGAANDAKATVEAGATLSTLQSEDFSSAGWLAMCIARELYHSSGAFRPANDETLSDERVVAPRFCSLSFPIIEQLASIPAASVAHHLVQTLVFLSRLEPKRAFLAIARIATPGSGYEYESLAESEVLGFVDGLLAERRGVILDDEECLRALRHILDTFVAVGSDQAIHRVQDLGELFR
jgi:hypothetical protein